MDFKETFKKLVDRNDTNQTDLAKYVGFTPQTVSKWYNGKAEPNTETIKKIARYFNVSTDYLLGNDLNIDNQDEKQKEIDALEKLLKENSFMNKNDKLSNEQVKNIIDFIVTNKKYIKK